MFAFALVAVAFFAGAFLDAAAFFAGGAPFSTCALVGFLAVDLAVDLVVVVFFVAAAFFAGGAPFSTCALVGFFSAVAFLSAGLASFTGPEAPVGGSEVSEWFGGNATIANQRRCHETDPSRQARGVIIAIVATITSWSDHSGRRTLGARKDAALASFQKSAVELGGELRVGDAGEVVVGLDVLLESLSADGNAQCQLTVY